MAGVGRLSATLPARCIVEVDRLVVRRSGHPILAGLSFLLQSGGVTGLLGPSGSGKTTLMRSIVGVQRIDEGTVTILGLPAGHPALRRRIAYTTQAPATYADLTVHENFVYFGRIVGAPHGHVPHVIEHVGLGGLEKRVVASLSGGEQARVSLGVALLGNAELLVLDEPTVGLDPLLRIDLWELFHSLANSGKTLLVSSHVLDEATHCSSLLLLREGRLLAEGSPAALVERAGVKTMEEAFVALVRRQETAA